jgi:acetylornithine deacetylase
VDAARLAERLTAEPDAQHALTAAADALGEAGLTVDRDEEHQAIAAVRGSPGAVLSGHVDVVPVSDEWSRPAFGNAFDDDRLYARGASDMRGPVAAMIAALDRTEAPVGVVLTTDEETTMDTVRAYAEHDRFADADVVLVGEPTGMDVAVAGNGLVWVRVDADGARGHASTPRPQARGPSAPERLIEALAGLDPRPFRVEHPRLGKATLAVSGIESEATPFNVLAGEAEARIDIRFPPPKTPDEVEASLRSRLDLPREGLKLSVEKREPAFLGDEGQGKRAADALSLAGVDASVTGVGYVTEAGHWQRVTDTLVVGPGSIDRAHAPDEYITRDELTTAVDGYAALIEAFAPA